MYNYLYLVTERPTKLLPEDPSGSTLSFILSESLFKVLLVTYEHPPELVNLDLVEGPKKFW